MSKETDATGRWGDILRKQRASGLWVAAFCRRWRIAQASIYAWRRNQWSTLTLFITDPAVPVHNSLAEQEMKRIALLRKNALFVATPNGSETAAILSSLTSTCRRHGINPQLSLTQLPVNLPDTPVNDIDQWLPDQRKRRLTGHSTEDTTKQA